MTKHAYLPTTVITDEGTALFHDYFGNYTNFVTCTQLCNDKESTKNRESGANTCISQNESQGGM